MDRKPPRRHRRQPRQGHRPGIQRGQAGPREHRHAHEAPEPRNRGFRMEEGHAHAERVDHRQVLQAVHHLQAEGEDRGWRDLGSHRAQLQRRAAPRSTRKEKGKGRWQIAKPSRRSTCSATSSFSKPTSSSATRSLSARTAGRRLSAA